MQRSLGRIEGKLDGVLATLPTHEHRIAKLEKTRAVVYGAGAVIVFLLGAAVKVFAGMVK